MEINIIIDDDLKEKIRRDLIDEDLREIIDQYYGNFRDLPKAILLKIPEYLYPLICLLIASENIVEIYITREVPKNIFPKDIIYVEIERKKIPKNPNILLLDLNPNKINIELSLNKISGN